MHPTHHEPTSPHLAPTSPGRTRQDRSAHLAPGPPPLRGGQVRGAVEDPAPEHPKTTHLAPDNGARSMRP